MLKYVIITYVLPLILPIIYISLVIYFLYLIFRNPFRYPYFKHFFDISGKRNVDIKNYIDKFLCIDANWKKIQEHKHVVQQWEKDSLLRVEKSILKKYRMKQLQTIIDVERTYHFYFVRKQTRYKQLNYVKTPYKITVIDSKWATSWSDLENRYNQLAAIGFESTIQEYNSKNQRKLMTKTLRDKIKIRDHFTCQRCGKYMPDEVGLHIDHIIPIAKGGKSVPSNLRVLCDKCNCNKGAKIEI